MSRTVIANPIYDSVFKYLMEDIPAARVLLSALLQRKIGEIELKRNEYTRTKTKDEISVLRVDFAAEIFNDDGSRELVTIEIQKTYLSTEIMRFRRYLAAHYSDETNAIVLSDRPNRKRALHIITIYLLGHEVEELDNAVTYVYPRMYDQNMNEIDKKVNEVEFVDGLVHDMIVVQIPKITSAKVVSHLDRILSVFDQRNIVPSCQRELTVDDSTYTDDADEGAHRPAEQDKGTDGTVGSKGQPVGAAGNSVGSKGQPVSSAGNSVSSAGNSVGSAGNSVGSIELRNFLCRFCICSIWQISGRDCYASQYSIG